MGKKFDTVFEQILQRAEIGGYLTGDLVKFRPKYKSSQCYKNLPSNLQQEVDELATCELNIKVVEVKNDLSGVFGSNILIVIAADHGGGRYYGRVAVTPDMIDMAQEGLFGTGPVPDKFKKKDVVIIKPVPVKRDPNFITNVTDKGNGKNTPTNLKLAGESAKPWDSTKDLAALYETIQH